MMQRKKFLVLMLCCLFFAGCGGDDSENEFDSTIASDNNNVIISKEVGMMSGTIHTENVDFPYLELTSTQSLCLKEFSLQVDVEPKGIINVQWIMLDNGQNIIMEINSVRCGAIYKCNPSVCFMTGRLFPQVELSLGPNAKPGLKASVRLTLFNCLTDPMVQMEPAQWTLSQTYEIAKEAELPKLILSISDSTGYYAESPTFTLIPDDVLRITGFTIQAVIESDMTLNGSEDKAQIEKIDFLKLNWQTGEYEVIGYCDLLFNDTPTTFSVDNMLLFQEEEIVINVKFKELSDNDQHLVEVKFIISAINIDKECTVEGLPLVIKARYDVYLNHPAFFIDQYTYDQYYK